MPWLHASPGHQHLWYWQGKIGRSLSSVRKVLNRQDPGAWFNIKMLSCQYRISHGGDKTVVRSSYLHNGISYTSKMSSLYWIGAQVRIILWCLTTKMFIKACFLIQPLEQEGRCQKCCISLCSKVFINHFYQMTAGPEFLNILIYWGKYWVDRLRRTLRRKSLNRNILSTYISTLPLYFTSSCPHRLQRS